MYYIRQGKSASYICRDWGAFTKYLGGLENLVEGGSKKVLKFQKKGVKKFQTQKKRGSKMFQTPKEGGQVFSLNFWWGTQNFWSPLVPDGDEVGWWGEGETCEKNPTEAKTAHLMQNCAIFCYFKHEIQFFKGVLHLWALFLKTLCIFSKNKPILDKVSYGSGQRCSTELKNDSFTSVEAIVVKLQRKMCENQYFPCFEP